MCRLKLASLSVPVMAQSGRSANNQSPIPTQDQAFYPVVVDYNLFRSLGRRPSDTSPKY